MDPIHTINCKIDSCCNVPGNILLNFNEVEIRIYKNDNLDGYLFVSGAIPAFKDYDGDVWEQDFSQPSNEEDEEEESRFDSNSFPSETVSLNEIASLLELHMEHEEVKEQ